MDLNEIIAVAGKPGLYKVVANGRNSVIVESLTDGKKIPAYASSKISALEDISIFTTGEDVPLGSVLKSIYEKEKGGKAIDHNKSPEELQSYLESVLPTFDKERVYNSDIKKLFQWYNILQETGNLKLKEEEKKPKAKAASKQTAEEKKEGKKKAEKKDEPKKAKPKSTAIPKDKKTAAPVQKTAKPLSGGKKAATPKKTSTSRGK